VVIPTDFITPILYISQVTHMKDDESIVERVVELLTLDEVVFLANFHQTIEKDRQKAWHDRHIEKKLLHKVIRFCYMKASIKTI
jgi:hypothetical protein